MGLTPWKESYDQSRRHIKKQRHYFANKGPSSQGYGFSSGHVWMWELDCKESWVLKNWCFWTVVLEKTLESPLDCKEIQPVHPKGGQSWVFIGRTDAEAETPILWPPHAKSWLIGKDSAWAGTACVYSLMFLLLCVGLHISISGNCKQCVWQSIVWGPLPRALYASWDGWQDTVEMYQNWSFCCCLIILLILLQLNSVLFILYSRWKFPCLHGRRGSWCSLWTCVCACV